MLNGRTYSLFSFSCLLELSFHSAILFLEQLTSEMTLRKQSKTALIYLRPRRSFGATVGAANLITRLSDLVQKSMSGQKLQKQSYLKKTINFVSAKKKMNISVSLFSSAVVEFRLVWASSMPRHWWVLLVLWVMNKILIKPKSSSWTWLWLVGQSTSRFFQNSTNGSAYVFTESACHE